MFADVVLPNLGFGMEEGRLVSWLKAIGDPVQKGEAIAEVESDKTIVELASTVDGIVAEILFAADQVVPVGSILARVQTDLVTAVVKAVTVPPVEPRASEPRVTPVARKVAEEHGIDLTKVVGTGTGGRIRREDVEAQTTLDARPLAAPAVRHAARESHIDLRQVPATGSFRQVTRDDLNRFVVAQQTAGSQASPVSVPAPSTMPISTAVVTTPAPRGTRTEIPLTPMRQAIGRRLVQSAQEAPHFYVTTELDLTPALIRLPREVGINNLLLYLTVQTLTDHPNLNATFENGHLYQYGSINLAIAVALPTGLITPVLQQANDFSLSGLATRARELIERARDGRLRPEELGGGTFTVSNLGVVKQVDHFTAIINPPQVGILAVGTAKPRPMVVDGGLHIRTTVHLTLSADHRLVDGLAAARFLETFDQRLHAFAG